MEPHGDLMTKRLHALTLLLTLTALLIGAANLFGQTPVAAADISYKSYITVNVADQAMTYVSALTHRYVGTDLRFLILRLDGTIAEFSIAGKGPGSTVNTTTGSWQVPSGVLNNFNSLNWDESKGKVWVTSAEDYTNIVRPTRISLLTLGANGTVSLDGQWSIAGVNAKRVYGGVLKVPTWAKATMGGDYIAGWGGYTSLVMQGGGASMGPSAVAIDDPTTYPSGSVLPVRKVVLDAYPNRGVRKTIPQNYFDGGDTRQNPNTPPTGPPVSSGQWLSPNAQGLGWWVWGDGPYNTGFFVDTPGRRGFGMVPSLCKGRCWYQTSTLAFDGRTAELHVWDVSKMGSSVTKAPDVMVELPFPDGSARVWGGNGPTGNIAGATFDPKTGTLYALGTVYGTNDYDARLFSVTIAGATGTAPPEPPVTAPATFTPWSDWTGTAEWSTCVGGTQSRPEQRTRTVLTPAVNLPQPTPADLLETRTASQACTVAPPPAPSYPAPVLSVKTCTVTQPALATSPDGTTGWTMQLKRNGVNFGTADTTAPYGPRTYSSLPPGTWAITATWTKAGQPTVTTVLGSVVCGG